MMFFKSILPMAAVLFAFFPTSNTQSIYAQDNLKYCNAVQNDVGLIRYSLRKISVTSTEEGEIGDAMTLVPRVYPCLNSLVVKGAKDDWRASISGDPSMLVVNYEAKKPCGATKTAITVTPHVSVFKVTFPEGTQDKYLVFDFTKYRVDDWAALYKWTERTVTRIDDRTIQATIGEPGKIGAYYTIKFSVPCIGSGTIDSSGVIKEGAIKVTGTKLGIYARFDSPTVTVVIAGSYTSMGKAEEFLTSEVTDFDNVHQRCLSAWNQVLNHVEIEGSENSKRMAYSALYSMLVNIIDGSDGSVYLKYYSRPRSIASSAYWQFIGGFQSCCWDNFRTVYPFLMLSHPETMTDVVNTYLSRYQRDGIVAGNIGLFTGPTGGHISIRFTPVLIAEAQASGIQADYSKLYEALKDNFDNETYLPESFNKLGYITQPPSGGKACSHTLEFATSLHALAMLAKVNDDNTNMEKYLRLSKNYANLWDSSHMAFRVKNEDGSWGVVEYETNTWNPNPQGLFEGTTADWMFAVPHDPYGLIDLPGQKDFVKRVVNYSEKDTWFNDYQYNYPYLLYYADAANEAQKILRNVWIPLFKDGIIYEGVSPKPGYNPWKTHYTSNAGWLLCSMLGLYPMNAPSGQYIITSPAIEKAVIHHGDKAISVHAKNNSEENIYIRSIKVDGKNYPCYMIPAQRLTRGAKIELDMTSDPSLKLGSLYISSTDGFVQSVELVSDSRLKCVIEAAIIDATTKIYSKTKPVKVLVNGEKDKTWTYDEAKKTVTIQTAGTASIAVFSM